jgi:hypothetical protein
MSVLFVSNDLFSSSQFAGVIRQTGLEVRVALSASQDYASAPEAIVVFDLETADAISSIALAKSLGKTVVAFGPHVKTALLDTAKLAGCDAVLTRGQAVRDLGTVTQQLASRAS